jgi:hypothetical protein
MKHPMGALIFLAVLSPVLGGEVCRTRSGYVAVRDAILVGCEQINPADLREVFRQWLDQPDPGEAFVIATCDPDFHAVIENLYLAGRRGSERPLAYLFRFGDNAFVQFRDAAGRVDWFTIRGENLFQRRFGETWVRFGRHDLRLRRAWGTRIWCEETNRELLLAIVNPRREDLIGAAHFYRTLFSGELSGHLTIFMEESTEMVLRLMEFPPSLEFLGPLRDKLAENDRQEAEFLASPDPYPPLPPPPQTRQGWSVTVFRGSPKVDGFILITHEGEKVYRWPEENP